MILNLLISSSYTLKRSNRPFTHAACSFQSPRQLQLSDTNNQQSAYGGKLVDHSQRH